MSIFNRFIDFYSFRITAFITGPIQESLIMNQASGQANKSANQLAIMSIVFNFTMTMWKTLKRETKMNDVHSRKCLCNVHFACLRIGASKEFSQSSNKERDRVYHDGDDTAMAWTRIYFSLTSVSSIWCFSDSDTI